MKTLKYLFLLIILFVGYSCEKEQVTPVTADFEITVVNDDYSVPVQVKITNNTTGADTYEWTFEGATTTSSSAQNPGTIIYTSKGDYTITLKASNQDGSVDTTSVDIQIDAAMSVDFDWEMQGSDISPVTLKMVDNTKGATSYSWEFQDGTPATSNDSTPSVVFSSAGEHTIKLTISNGRETYSTEKTVTVQPAMTVGFDWSVDFIDNDYQAPVTIHTSNSSTNADSYLWSVAGANPTSSSDSIPDFTFSNAGTYTVSLTATNDKESKTASKQITIYTDQNLLSFTDIKLGINTAQSLIGCFFSSVLGKVITSGDVSDENGSEIDFAYFGLNDAFSYNQFLSPDQVQTTAFSSIPNAIHTKIINSQESVGTILTASQFEAIDNGRDFSNITISETDAGKTPFSNALIPRIIPFETEDGRKGAIKIKSYVSDGKSSYVLVDIKVQKE